MLTAVDGSVMRWVSTAIARRALGVTRQRVYQLVDDGKLASCRIHGQLMISSASIDARLSGQEELFNGD